MEMSTTHSSFDHCSTALVTKLLVIEQLLHPVAKPTVSAPWHNFNISPPRNNSWRRRWSSIHILNNMYVAAILRVSRVSRWAVCRSQRWSPDNCSHPWQNLCCKRRSDMWRSARRCVKFLCQSVILMQSSGKYICVFLCFSFLFCVCACFKATRKSWLSRLVSLVQSSCLELCTDLVYFCFWTN